MGPAATAYFFELLTQLADAGTDQEHVEILIISRPSIPDRTDYILGRSAESPVPPIIEAGRTLAALGADLIAIPCVTAHFFFDELAGGINAPLVNMVRETAGLLTSKGVKSAGLMAADGTVFSGVFSRELEAHGIRAVLPEKPMQKLVMDLIYNNVKANNPYDLNGFTKVADDLRANGAETVILACTELSLFNRDCELAEGFEDAMEILARRCLELCGSKVIPRMPATGRRRTDSAP